MERRAGQHGAPRAFRALWVALARGERLRLRYQERHRGDLTGGPQAGILDQRCAPCCRQRLETLLCQVVPFSAVSAPVHADAPPSSANTGAETAEKGTTW